MNPETSQLRREWLAIAAITVVGAILRFWAFDRVSLSHFDEGIYAFSGLWIVSKQGMLGLDPDVIPYAPPIFQILVGLAYLVAGVRDYAAIGVATICGAATIPVVGLIGRWSFGPGAGAAAAFLGALALPHIAFSRKALTDAPFLLAWLVAIALGIRLLEKLGAVRAVLLGLAIGVAQNVKYNGWLVGVIVLMAASADALARPEARHLRPLLRAFGWLLAAALIAVIVYAPWYFFVEANLSGGYSGLLRHHRSYMGGASSWPAHWHAQMIEASALAGPYYWRAATWVLAALGALWVLGPVAAHGCWKVRRIARLAVAAALFALAPNLAWWFALGWTPWLLLSSKPAWRVLGSWWLLMTVLVPFYHPYARLWLPLHALGWVVLGGLIVQVSLDGDQVFGIAARYARPLLAGCVALALVQALILPRPFSLGSFLNPDPSASLREFSWRLADQQQRAEGANFEVWARRPLAFYLAERQNIRFQSAPDLDTLLQRARPGVWAVVDQAVELQDGIVADVRPERAWNPAWTFQNAADPVTVLDTNPLEPLAPVAREVFNIRVLSPRDSSRQGPP